VLLSDFVLGMGRNTRTIGWLSSSLPITGEAMTQRGYEPDRRKHARIEAKGTVTLHALGAPHRARLANIGAGGMYVVVEGAVPDRLLEQAVDLELRFDGPLAVWQRLAGRVSRIDGKGVAVTFDAAPAAALLRMIDELSTASYASSRVISVVLVDPDGARRAAITAGFTATGCDVIEVATPLEAIVRLGESHFEPDVIAVANTSSGDAADEIRRFIEREHPNAMLVAIGPELLDPAGLARWLSSATAAADLPARIRSLLFAPLLANR